MALGGRTLGGVMGMTEKGNGGIGNGETGNGDQGNGEVNCLSLPLLPGMGSTSNVIRKSLEWA